MNAVKSYISSKRLASVVNWILLLTGLWLTVNFIWSFWPQQPAQSETSRPAADSSRDFDLQAVLQADLFGSPDATDAPQPQQITAPVTRLNLKLRGVYASDEDFASAMIEHNRQQEVYRIGSSLPGATGLTLYQVFSDRVIMSRDGKYETLYIEDFDGSTARGSSQVTPRQTLSRPVIRRTEIEPEIEPEVVTEEIADQAGEQLDASQGRDVVDLSTDQEVTRQLLELRENLDDPTALNEVVSLQPENTDDGFQGFRLAPGNNRQLFGRLGLRRGDILSEVNGITMTDPTAGMAIYDQLTSADEISLTVIRNGRPIEIKLSAVVF